ncbi:uncharacterized protein ARMOST_14382 [Armillaria ostoyae]|uniref:Uncharacterized protein n=1 Tax=Armillaria ostoyae TaxID=47428 RepID=A0A284RQM0_ARMOS|nr:uncharacterized protein ARMOST_14382 [Armillaria ostoyae]
MDKLSRKEQITLAARTTIMMGVHGNGLTSLLWMNPSPRSTVIEFFFPGGRQAVAPMCSNVSGLHAFFIQRLREGVSSEDSARTFNCQNKWEAIASLPYSLYLAAAVPI